MNKIYFFLAVAIKGINSLVASRPDIVVYVWQPLQADRWIPTLLPVDSEPWNLRAAKIQLLSIVR